MKMKIKNKENKRAAKTWSCGGRLELGCPGGEICPPPNGCVGDATADGHTLCVCVCQCVPQNPSSCVSEAPETHPSRREINR